MLKKTKCLVHLLQLIMIYYKCENLPCKHENTLMPNQSVRHIYLSCSVTTQSSPSASKIENIFIFIFFFTYLRSMNTSMCHDVRRSFMAVMFASFMLTEYHARAAPDSFFSPPGGGGKRMLREKIHGPTPSPTSACVQKKNSNNACCYQQREFGLKVRT